MFFKIEPKNSLNIALLVKIFKQTHSCCDRNSGSKPVADFPDIYATSLLPVIKSIIIFYGTSL